MLTVVAFLVLLGVLITVHELGHFLVAKACGVRVLTFSIGFGPRLFGFTRGETEYRVSVLPLGGYVRMYGDDANEEIPVEERHRAFLTQPFLKKSAIAVAGPAANFILPVVLFVALFVGVRSEAAAVLGTVVPGEAAAIAGLRSGDRVVAIDGTSVNRYAELQKYVEPRAGVPIRLTIERDGTRQDVQVTPRASPSPTIFDASRSLGRLGVIAGVKLPVVTALAESPAGRAGIRDLDRIQAVNGTPVRDEAALFAALDAGGDEVRLEVVAAERRSDSADRATGTDDDGTAAAQTRLITLTRDESSPPPRVVYDRFGVTADELAPLAPRIDATAAAAVQVLEDARRRFGLGSIDGRVAHVAPGTVAAEKGLQAERDHIIAVDGKRLASPTDLENALRADPDGIHVVAIVGAEGARTLAFRMLPAPERQLAGIKVFGVALSAAYGDIEEVQRHIGPAEAVGLAVQETRGLVVDVFRGFSMLFTGKVGLESLGGPITIAKMSGQAAELGVEHFIRLMGLISVNLAIINLMPVPVLDGGHLLMFTIELVTRRRMSVETRLKITKVGLILVGMLMLIAVGNDILGLF